MSHLQWGKSHISQVNGKKLLFSIGEAYHLRREETDWFDKPRDGRLDNGQERRQVKLDRSMHDDQVLMLIHSPCECLTCVY